MTTTTATAKLRFIPETGATLVVGEREIRTFWVNGAGWTVQIRRNGTFESAQMHRHEHQAVDAVNTLGEQYEAETPADVETAAPAAEVTPIAGNHGTAMRVSDPAHTVLALAATAHDGIVEQGGKLGQATRTQIRSLARKGYLTEIYETGRSDARLVIEGGRITAKGRRRLAELTAADTHAARINAAIAA